MSSYLRRLAQVFAHEVGDELQKYTFVFPNHRAGLFFRRYLGESLSHPLFAPEIMTINECFESLSDLRIIDQLSLIVRLYEIYSDLRPGAEPICSFLHWGKMMLADFSEIDNHLVKDVMALYTAVDDIRDIDVQFVYLTDTQRDAISRFWGEYHSSQANHQGHMHTNFLHTWKLLYPMYERLTKELLKEGLAYEGLLHRQVITNWKAIASENFRQYYVFVGFNALTASERQLMINLRDCGRADFYFDYEDDCLSDSSNRASLFKEYNLNIFPSKYNLPPRDISQRPSITHISVSSTIGEAHEVYHILNELYSENSVDEDFTRTAVVLPDEQLLIPLLNCFPTSVKKINVTMGYPLRGTALYKPIAYPEKYFSKLPEGGTDMLHLLRTTFAKMRNDANSDAVYMINKVLEQIETVICRYPNLKFSCDAVVQILRMLTLEISIPYVGEPLDGLQVMGVLETRALDFDNLIITGFNDDLYPGRSRANSFIPYVLRRGFDLPTPERQDAIFAYNFYRMLSYAKNVWLITNAVADDIHSGEVSRYLYQLQWQYNYRIQQVHVVNSLSTPSIKESSIIKTEGLLLQLDKLKERSFSASAINTYLYCPKKFYYKYVLGIKEPPQSEEITASDATLGTILHETLQMLYQPFEKKVVTSLDIQSIIDTLEDKWNILPLWKLEDDPLALNVEKMYVRYLLHYDLTQTPYYYYSSEFPVNGKLEVPSVGEINFYGKIDRIDLQKNVLRVIDYKTGAAKLEFKDVSQIFDRKENQDRALQTLMYCWLLKQSKRKEVKDKQLTAHVYAIRSMANPEDVSTRVHMKNVIDFTYTPEFEKDFLDGLVGVIQEIFNPEIPFCSAIDRTRCESCAYVQLCKK